MSTAQIYHTCICGKRFTTSIAFHTHSKMKHSTHPAKPALISQGRAALSLPNKLYQQQRRNRQLRLQESISLIEIGILDLDKKYKQKIISNQTESMDKDIFATFQKRSSKYLTIEQKVIEVVKIFGKQLVINMKGSVAKITIAYLKELSVFISQNLSKPSEDLTLKWEESQAQKIYLNCSVFNNFFSSKSNIQAVRYYAKEINLSSQYFLDITILLSEWLFMLNLSENTIKRKGSAK